jgi:hypothetical protein
MELTTPHLRHARTPDRVHSGTRVLRSSPHTRPCYAHALQLFRLHECLHLGGHASISGFAGRKLRSGVLVPEDRLPRCVWAVCEAEYLRPCTCELRSCRFASKKQHDQCRGKREARRERGTHVGKIQRGPREKETKTLCITSPIRCDRRLLC